MENIPQGPDVSREKYIIARAGNLNERTISKINLTVELPEPFYALWVGAKIAHNLDEEFLKSLCETTIRLALVRLMDFGG